MKKLILFTFVFLALFLTVGCQATSATTDKDDTIYSVIVPNGGPAIAQMYLQNEPDKYSVDVVNGPDPLVAAFGSKSHDFIFTGTNLGAKFYANSPDYLFIAVFTLGNSYLVTQSDDPFTISSLEGKEIVAFGQNSTPDIVLRYILEQNNINCTIRYVDSVASATAEWIADHSKIILIAEPSLSILSGSNPGLDIIDLQTEYTNASGLDSYPQAGVFARTTLSNAAIDQFLADLESSINTVNTSVSASAQLGEDLGFGFSKSVLEASIPNNHLQFISALDARTNLEAYFSIIMDINPVLIGGALPQDSFYYNPSR